MVGGGISLQYAGLRETEEPSHGVDVSLAVLVHSELCVGGDGLVRAGIHGRGGRELVCVSNTLVLYAIECRTLN